MKKILDQIQNELPLSGDSTDDGRYVWPERWNRLRTLACETELQALTNALKEVRRVFKPWHSCAYIWVAGEFVTQYTISLDVDTKFKFDSIESMQAWVDRLKPNSDREIIHRKFKL